MSEGAVEQRVDIPALLARPTPGTHLYVCGPSAFMDLVIETAQHPQGPGHRGRRSDLAPRERLGELQLPRIDHRTGGGTADRPSAIERHAPRSRRREQPVLHRRGQALPPMDATAWQIAWMLANALRLSISSGNSTSNSPSSASITFTLACEVMPAW